MSGVSNSMHVRPRVNSIRIIESQFVFCISVYIQYTVILYDITTWGTYFVFRMCRPVPLFLYRRVPILLPFSISGFRNFGDFWLFSSNFATTREVGTPMRCVRCCLKLSASFDVWWSYNYDEQIGCKSRSKMNFRSLAIEIFRFWGAQLENWISSVTKITMLFPNPLSHLCEILCPRS